jgi:hypothetical protein
MTSLWSVSKSLHLPIDSRLLEIQDLPYTISFIIRKMSQVDNLNELPKEKKPTDKQIWDSPTEDLEIWLDEVFKGKIQPNIDFVVNDVE